MKQVEYLIIGQGLAGTMAAYFLKKAGASVLIIDDSHRHSASIVAAGLINPITGRRFAKSWRIDELLPFARQTYLELEEWLGISIYHERSILRALFSVKEENDWWARSTMPAFAPYMPSDAFPIVLEDYVHSAHATVETRYSAQVDTAALLPAFASRAIAEGWMQCELFDHAELQIMDHGVRYQDIQANTAIFCEGFGIQHNPFFPHLPIEGAKGEVLIVRIPGFPNRVILKHRIFIAPLGDDVFWAGATYDWDSMEYEPTEAQKQYLEERLAEVLKVPYEFIEQRAAIRATVSDRRPLLGRHPIFPQLVLFNGMGTKGASLSPFWAAHLAQVLRTDAPFDKEVDFMRFQDYVGGAERFQELD